MTERAFAQPGEDGLVCIGPRGAALRRNNFRCRTWLPASDERQRQIAAALGELAAGDLERKLTAPNVEASGSEASYCPPGQPRARPGHALTATPSASHRPPFTARNAATECMPTLPLTP
jgi:hypothetical protein